LSSQPDALGVATRLAAGRLREAGIVLEPLLRRAGSPCPSDRSAAAIHIIGTTNKSKYLHDTTGNQRFWRCKIKAVDVWTPSSICTGHS
jgi:hypothetical protein